MYFLRISVKKTSGIFLFDPNANPEQKILILGIQ
jgi:hypothetical protein